MSDKRKRYILPEEEIPHYWYNIQADILSASIVLYCLYVRQKERLPKAGCRELYTLCREYLQEAQKLIKFCKNKLYKADAEIKKILEEDNEA